MGNYYRKKGEQTKAITQYQKAIQKQPQQLAFYVELASTYADNKESAQAFKIYDQIFSIDSNCSEAYFDRATLKTKLNDLEGAIKDYDKCFFLLEKNGDYNYDTKSATIEKSLLNICFKKAIAYQTTKQFDKAVKEYQQYINFNTANAEAYDNYGYCLLEIDKIPEAKNNFINAYTLNKKNPDIIVGLIVVSYLLNDKKKMAEYKKLLYQLKSNFSHSAKDLDMLVREGYNYTDKFSKIFEQCFK